MHPCTSRPRLSRCRILRGQHHPGCGAEGVSRPVHRIFAFSQLCTIVMRAHLDAYTAACRSTALRSLKLGDYRRLDCRREGNKGGLDAGQGAVLAGVPSLEYRLISYDEMHRRHEHMKIVHVETRIDKNPHAGKRRVTRAPSNASRPSRWLSQGDRATNKATEIHWRRENCAIALQSIFFFRKQKSEASCLFLFFENARVG